MAAGGTGGHVYPAIAIADALSSVVSSLEVLFVGTKNRMEWKAVPKAGYRIRPLWISGISRTQWWKNIWVPLKVVVSLAQSFWLCLRMKPDAVITCGGFVSGPIGKMATWLRIPLFIQEQNTHPGITSRMLAGQAKHIFLTFEDVDKHFNGLPQTVTGNPTRRALLNALATPSPAKQEAQQSTKPTVLLLGGSGGAGSLNQMVGSMLPDLGFSKEAEAPFSLVWQCGNAYLDRVETQLATTQLADHRDIHVTPFIEDMASAYKNATVVISRAGAGTLTELMLQSKAAILIPSPVVAGDHQRKNGQRLVDKGAALMVEESDMAQTLPTVLMNLLAHPEQRAQLASSLHAMANPNAAHDIANHILHELKTSMSSPRHQAVDYDSKLEDVS